MKRRYLFKIVLEDRRDKTRKSIVGIIRSEDVEGDLDVMCDSVDGRNDVVGYEYQRVTGSDEQILCGTWVGGDVARMKGRIEREMHEVRKIQGSVSD